MDSHSAKTEKDFRYIASLFCPKNTEYMLAKRRTPKEVRQSVSADCKQFILSLDNKPVGWFNIRRLRQDQEGRFGIIIDKPYQGRGLGKKAMELIEKEAKKLGVKKLKLEVVAKNLLAVKLYRKSGYKKTGEIIMMEKKL